MKPLLLLSILFSQLISVNAQLTNGQVYDFEIGDVFQITYDAGFPGPHPVYTDTIIGKTFSSGMDTITYSIKRLEYLASAVIGGSATYNESIDTLIVSGLNNPAPHFTYNTCLPATDTALTGSCSENINRIHSNLDTTCFEPPIWYSDIYQGLGGPYYYRYDNSISGSSTDWVSVSLTYFNSSQYGECGIAETYSIVDEKIINELNIFPNPTSSTLNINTKHYNSTFRIYSQMGKIIQFGTINNEATQLDISNLKCGYYIIEILGEKSLNRKTFIKQ